MHKNSTRKVMSIDIKCTPKDIQSDINKWSEVNSIRNCGDCDENTDEEDNDIQYLRNKCGGRMTTSAMFSNATCLLTIWSS